MLGVLPKRLLLILGLVLFGFSILATSVQPVYAKDIKFEDSLQYKIIKYCSKKDNSSDCIIKQWGGPASQRQINQDCSFANDVKEPDRCINDKLSTLKINEPLLDKKNNNNTTKPNDGSSSDNNSNGSGSSDIDNTGYANTKCFTALGGDLQEKICPKSGIFPNKEPPKTDKCYASMTKSANGLEEYEEVSCDKSTFSVNAYGEKDEKKDENFKKGNDCTNRTKLSAGWIVCSLVEVLSDGMDALVGYVDDMLDVDVAKMDKDGEMEKSWSYFRAIASFLLLGVGLAMIISQAIGGGNS